MASFRATAAARQARKRLAMYKSSEAMKAYREGYADGYEQGYQRALRDVM